jgi:hypothetical protein
MNVLVRPKRIENRIGRRRSAPAGRTHQNAGTTAVAEGRGAPQGSYTPPVPEGRRRELGPLQDQALYNCGCGYVFEAPVSTSVGCPHCGDTQAW